jgi:hypothetical protein
MFQRKQRTFCESVSNAAGSAAANAASACLRDDMAGFEFHARRGNGNATEPEPARAAAKPDLI